MDRIDKYIKLIRENMSVGAVGFTGDADAKGPVAGFDKALGKGVKRRKYLKLPPGSRKRWMSK